MEWEEEELGGVWGLKEGSGGPWIPEPRPDGRYRECHPSPTLPAFVLKITPSRFPQPSSCTMMRLR